MSKSKVAMRNVASAKKSSVKKPVVKAVSKPIKKTKSNPVAKVAAKSKAGQAKKVAPAKKVASVKKVVSSKENQAPAKAKKVAAKPLKEKEAKKVIESMMPKRPTTAYFAFATSRREQFMKENPKLSLCEAAKALALVWKSMDEKQKSKYNKASEEDKKRYQKEKNDVATKGFFINKDGENSKEVYMAKQRKLAQVQPKRPSSAYMFFVFDVQKAMKAKNPENMKVTEWAKEAASQWAKLSQDQRKKYDDLHKQDIKRHEKELKQLETKGYFVNKDGVKSTDMLKAKFKYPEGATMPKAAVTAYKFYVQDNCQKVQDQQAISQSEALNICSKVWEKLSDKQTAKYQALHDQDVIRREKQLIQLQQNGFFVREDGSKSTDAVKKSKK